MIGMSCLSVRPPACLVSEAAYTIKRFLDYLTTVFQLHACISVEWKDIVEEEFERSGNRLF